MSTPPKQQRLVLKGEATPQLTELLLQGWMVLGREGGVWTLERLSPSLLALPSSRREASRG